MTEISNFPAVRTVAAGAVNSNQMN